jgi:protein-L-isoaspartate(D-aspartate) O-methyltransferase
VTATAEGAAPPALLEQLAPGGTLVCPIRRVEGEYLVRVRGGVEEVLAAVRFVPLVSDE